MKQRYLHRRFIDLTVTSNTPSDEAEKIFPDKSLSVGFRSRHLMKRTLAVYLTLYFISFALINLTNLPELTSLGLGLILPGAGFLLWEGWGLIAFGLSCATLLFSLFLWLATGNVLAPLVVWIGGALLASAGLILGFEQTSQNYIPVTIQFASLALVSLFVGGTLIHDRRANKLRQAANETVRRSRLQSTGDSTDETAQKDELSLKELQLMRLLYDRALQPVESFEGFEWLDQFQTAAVRYQINFASYALSLTQKNYLPALKSYHIKAQQNLLVKLQDERIWGYWQLENSWGNLNKSADPIARDNIMYSGFMLAQMQYATAAAGHQISDQDIHLHHKSGQTFRYSQQELVKALHTGYQNAPLGLMACEPNWIYPLCNVMTATGLASHDKMANSEVWQDLKAEFKEALENEFITPSGDIISARSSYTGFATPDIGGAALQAFPIYFLNAVYPDIAERQWILLKAKMAKQNWRKALWPVDVGNYGLSRASSYGAVAAAAVEIGDTETAQEMLDLLEKENPLNLDQNVAHRSKASLWAHAAELMARAGQKNSLQELVNQPTQAYSGAFISKVDYPKVLVAKARQTHDGNGLDMTLYPGDRTPFKQLTIGGLVPGCCYSLGKDGSTFNAYGDQNGELSLTIPLHDRTQLSLHPGV